MSADILYLTEQVDPNLDAPQLPLTPQTNLYAIVTDYLDRHPMRGVCVMFRQGLTDDQLIELSSIIELCGVHVYALKVPA